MSIFPAFDISASALDAQRLRMDLASANLANAQTTRGPDGGPYKKMRPIFATQPLEFEANINEASLELSKVRVSGVQKDETPPRQIYDPTHPDANAQGFVGLPNVNLMEEMADLLLANRSYEANVTAFNMSKTMALSALNLGKV